MTVATAVLEKGKVASRGQLLALGFSDWQIRSAMASGSIRRAAPGVYILGDPHPMSRHLAENHAALTCFSAAKEMGLWVLHAPEAPHVGTAHGRPVPGCVTHRYKGTLTFWDIVRHCTRCGTDVEVLCVLESAVIKKRCTISELRREFSRRKDARIRRLIDLIDPQSMSIAETCARFHLLKAGHSVQVQYHVRKMGHLDAMVDGQLGLEIDGREFHDNAKAWAEDLRRGNVLTVRDVPTLRIRASVAMYHPEEMLRWVEQALATISARHSK